MKTLALFVSHAFFSVIGLFVGFYVLPLYVEPKGPSTDELVLPAKSAMHKSQYSGSLADCADVLQFDSAADGCATFQQFISAARSP